MKRDWRRAATHIPHGILVGILCCNPLTWKLASLFWKAFLAYELDECKHVKDEAWQDLFGFLIGIGVVAVLDILAGIVLVIKAVPIIAAR